MPLDLARPVEPYRLLFPLGVLFGLWGVLVWVGHASGILAYPALDHANLMIGGFAASFIAGLVMTALPRFTETDSASGAETVIVGGLLGLGALAAILVGVTGTGTGTLPGLLALAVFALRRLRRGRAGPAPFVLVPVGILIAIVGAALPLIDRLLPLDPRALFLARNLFLHGFVLVVLLGVGSRLTTMLREQVPRPLLGSQLDGPLERRAFLVIGLLIVGGYVIEAFGDAIVGRAIVAVSATVVLVRSWRIGERPSARGPVPVGLVLAAWSLLVGLWGAVLWPDARIHWLHLTLVAGISLIVLLVATRVVLSHGGHDVHLERRSRLLWLIVIGIVAAAAARMAGGLGYGAYERHLVYASTTWAACLVVWFVHVGRRIGRSVLASPSPDH
jgi:uncharacterized protein involved in response to NO